jgi:hypothetical protein
MLKFVTIISMTAITMLGVSGVSHAQTTAPVSPSAPTAVVASAPMVISPEKEKLIQRILQLWHVENVGMIMLQQPVAESIRQSNSLLQGRVSAEHQEAIMKEINQDTQKFMEDVAPTVHASALKLIPTTVEPILAEKFTEEELRQIISFLESKVKTKFEALVPEMEQSLGVKIAADTGPTINPKLVDLAKQIGLRMRTAITP